MNIEFTAPTRLAIPAVTIPIPTLRPLTALLNSQEQVEIFKALYPHTRELDQLLLNIVDEVYLSGEKGQVTILIMLLRKRTLSHNNLPAYLLIRSLRMALTEIQAFTLGRAPQGRYMTLVLSSSSMWFFLDYDINDLLQSLVTGGLLCRVGFTNELYVWPTHARKYSALCVGATDKESAEKEVKDLSPILQEWKTQYWHLLITMKLLLE